MMPTLIDLFCGLGGWSEGFLAEGWRCVGFDIERHVYPKVARESLAVKRAGMNWSGSDKPGYKAEAFNSTAGIEFSDSYENYPGQLVLQDVLTIHGSQFRHADMIVASPPCQRYSYMAMPWKRAKAMRERYRQDIGDLNALFDACFRIQREASEAAGRHIPLIVENVKGAQPWVGRAAWHYGSFYLWGDVPALMPRTFSHKAPQDGLGGYGGSFGWNNTPMRRGNSKSEGRKAASAQIAKIPFELSSYIARVFRPDSRDFAF